MLAAAADVSEPKEKPKVHRDSIAHVPLKSHGGLQYTGEVFFGRGNSMQPITVQFDTGSAIVYVLTDKCTDDCNAETKFKVNQPKDASVFSEARAQLEESLNNRIEYGYGSGYINGALADQQICFANSTSAPCVDHVKIL